MKLIYLESALEDLSWFVTYYEKIFPQRKERARRQLYSIESLLEKNPYIGHPAEIEGLRELSIPKIPFSLLYRIKNNNIEIINVWDERKNH